MLVYHILVVIKIILLPFLLVNKYAIIIIVQFYKRPYTSEAGPVADPLC